MSTETQLVLYLFCKKKKGYRCIALVISGCRAADVHLATDSEPNIPLCSPLVPGLGLLVVIGRSEQTAQVHHGNIVCRLEPDSLLVVSGRQLPLPCTTGEEEGEERWRKRGAHEWERERRKTESERERSSCVR